MKPTRKAIGERGSWFATVDGERLPCVHKHWVKGTHHFDPGHVGDDPKWMELVSAIEKGKKVILTKDRPYKLAEKKNGLGFERDGYIAVFGVDNIVADENGLAFDLVARVTELK